MKLVCVVNAFCHDCLGSLLSPARAITAHFGGYGRTLVVGSDAAEVDKVSQLCLELCAYYSEWL